MGRSQEQGRTIRKLHTRGSPKLLGDLSVLDQTRIVQTQSPDSLSHIRATGDRTSTSKRLELDVRDDSLVIDLDLKLHDVSTSGSTDETGTDVRIVLVHRSDLDEEGDFRHKVNILDHDCRSVKHVVDLHFEGSRSGQ